MVTNQSRRKNIVRNIRKNLNRFLSIMFIVALGAGFMAGLSSASPDMYESADRYMDAYHLFDIRLTSVSGFSDETISQIKNLDQIQEAEGGWVYDMVLSQKDGSDFTSRVYGILDGSGASMLNQIHLIEGRLPENPGECVAESVFGKYSDELISIGDELALTGGSSNYALVSRAMAQHTLTVVGICESPMCISIEGDTTNIGSGTINLNVYTPKELFAGNDETDLFLTVKGAEELNTFTEAYRVMVKDAQEQVQRLGQSLKDHSSQSMQDSLKNQMEEAENHLGRLEPVSEIQMDLQESLSGNQTLTDRTSGSMKNPSLKDALNQVSASLESAGQTEVSSSELMRNLENTITQEQELLDLFREGTWILRTRDDLAGYDSYYNNVGKVSALAGIFPVFFFVVALLVALTTMTRLVEENRLEIGTLKALGYTGGQILSEYLLFSILASVCGCIIGFSIGFYIFPAAINKAYSMMYILPPMNTPVRWDVVAYVAPVTIVSILVAAIWSCWNEFRSVPARLMTPRAPAAGKRIWMEHIRPVWKKLSFTYKVTFRNLFRYKKRFYMTIIGVAGCSALLLTGFGIRDSVNEILDKQFGEIYRYDMMFSAMSPGFAGKDASLQAVLSDPSRIQSWLLISLQNAHISAGTKKQELSVMVPEDENRFPDFVTLRSRRTHEAYHLPDDGAILTEKLCEEMNIHAGDLVTLELENGFTAPIRVSAITENYVSSFAYLSERCYETLFHDLPSYTGLLCIGADDAAVNGSEEDQPDLVSSILSSPYILYGRSVRSLRETFSESIKSINGVIYVLILAAGLLCIVVLYNLINVNICERRKELATLQVLGFYPNEMQNYIFRETNILSFLGSLAGLVIGIWLHSFVVRTVEVNHIMFGRDISLASYLLALMISLGFTLIVDIIMRRPIRKIDMVEAMKAND